MIIIKTVLKWLGNLLALVLLLLVIFLIQGWFRYADAPAPGLQEGPGQLDWIEVSGAPVAVRTQGLDRAGTPVIMVHSMFYHMGMWDTWAAELARTTAGLPL